MVHREEPVAQIIDVEGGYEVQRNSYQTEEMAGYLSWRHLRTVVRVETSCVGCTMR